MSEYTDVFVGILLFSFGLFTFLAGLFTAYFGAGKSRAIGFVLVIVGSLAMLLFATLTWPIIDVVPATLSGSEHAIVVSLVGVVASAVGAIVALIVFLISIMKA
jgi:hypothetical protein